MTVRNPTSQENQGTTPQAERPTLTIANFQYSCALCGPNMTYPCEHWLSYLNAGRAVAPVETPVTKCCNRWYLHRHVETPPTRNCCKCGAPISECMGFVKASDFADLLNGVRPGIVDGRCNIRELCGKCALLFMWDGDNLIKWEIVETRLTAEQLAQKFHEAYERLAPQFSYETRKASAKPWGEVPENNRNLMIAVCAEILEAFRDKSESERVSEQKRYIGQCHTEHARLRDVLLSFVKKFRIKSTGGICQICRCRFKHAEDCLVRKAEQIL